MQMHPLASFSLPSVVTHSCGLISRRTTARDARRKVSTKVRGLRLPAVDVALDLTLIPTSDGYSPSQPFAVSKTQRAQLLCKDVSGTRALYYEQSRGTTSEPQEA